MFNKNIEILKWIAVGKTKLDAADGNPAEKKIKQRKSCELVNFMALSFSTIY